MRPMALRRATACDAAPEDGQKSGKKKESTNSKSVCGRNPGRRRFYGLQVKQANLRIQIALCRIGDNGFAGQRRPGQERGLRIMARHSAGNLWHSSTHSRFWVV